MSKKQEHHHQEVRVRCGDIVGFPSEEQKTWDCLMVVVKTGRNYFLALCVFSRLRAIQEGDIKILYQPLRNWRVAIRHADD